MSHGSGERIVLQSVEVPDRFTLASPSPNPFNPETTVRFSMPTTGRISLVVYDILGRKVLTLFDEYKARGWHSASWKAVGVPSGTYILVGRSASGTQSRRLTLIK